MAPDRVVPIHTDGPLDGTDDADEEIYPLIYWICHDIEWWVPHLLGRVMVDVDLGNLGVVARMPSS